MYKLHPLANKVETFSMSLKTMELEIELLKLFKKRKDHIFKINQNLLKNILKYKIKLNDYNNLLFQKLKFHWIKLMIFLKTNNHKH